MNVAKQAAEPAPAGAYRYYAADAAGQVRLEEVQTVQNIADRTLFQRGNRWVDSQVLKDEDQKPDRVARVRRPVERQHEIRSAIIGIVHPDAERLPEILLGRRQADILGDIEQAENAGGRVHHESPDGLLAV